MKTPAMIGRLIHGSAQSSHKPALVAVLATMLAVSLSSISSPMQIPDLANLKVARLGHTDTELADGTVLIAGGQNETGEVSDSEIFDPAAKTFSFAAKLRQARGTHCDAALGRKSAHHRRTRKRGVARLD